MGKEIETHNGLVVLPEGSSRRPASGEGQPQFFQVSGCPGSAHRVGSRTMSHLLGKWQKNLFAKTMETFYQGTGRSFSVAALMLSLARQPNVEDIKRIPDP